MWPDLIRDFEEENLKQKGSSLAEQLAAERPVIEAAGSFGRAILPALVPHLESQDAEVRQMIANAAAMFPTQAQPHKQAIETALQRETEDWVRESLVAAHAAIMRAGEAAQAKTQMDVTQLPFNRLVGLEAAVEDSEFLISLPDGPQYTNHLGTVHASPLLFTTYHTTSMPL